MLEGHHLILKSAKIDLFAMIRQLGNPTWFCSFSAAETRWTHLLKTLGKIVEKKDYTDDEIKQMMWEQKSDLIQKILSLVQETLTTWSSCLFVTS